MNRRTSFGGALLPQDPAGQANIQLYTQVLPPSGTMALDSGNFFFLLSAAAAVNVNFQYDTGHIENMAGLSPGSQIKRIRNWRRCLITGTGGSAVSFWHGYAFTREDDTNFQTTIATISGAVSTVPGVGSSNAMTNHADVVVAATTIDTTIPANALRKGLVIGSKSTNAPGAGLNLRIQGGAGVAAQEGIELQPGTNFTFTGNFPASTAAYAIYNPAAGNQTYYWAEQT